MDEIDTTSPLVKNYLDCEDYLLLFYSGNLA